MKNQNEYYKNAYYTYLPVFLGMFAGSILFLVLMAFFETQIMEQGLEDYKFGAVLNIPVWRLALYILKRRLGQLFLFIIVWLLFSYPVAAFCFNACFGGYYGIVVCNLFIKFGWHGIVYSLACFFPHYLLYFIAIYFSGRWFYYMSSRKNAAYGNVNKLQYLVKIFVIFFLIFIALIWEIKFQKNILNYFYQYLV
ncbi:MAG: hypothetical protein HFJ06_16400 [Lachnospiraceae bacterium]|nr:hypothetical protein [Lachnospiraceae bacterium]